MKHLNVEIKAYCRHPEKVRQTLREAGAVLRGIDEQTDTYFSVSKGRLKLRRGTIENALIFYDRGDQREPKTSEVILYPAKDGGVLEEVLKGALEVAAVVRKRREIYFLENIKFHLDQVEGLGCFVEIEAMDAKGAGDYAALRRQCEDFMRRLGIESEDLAAGSYKEMLLQKGE